MDHFWKLLKESVLVQGTITILLAVTVAYLAIAGQEIPEVMKAMCSLTLGFYFGSKSQQVIAANKGEK